MARQLHPVSQTIVGWLFLTAGALLLLGLSLQLYVRFEQLRHPGAAGFGARELVLGAALLLAALLMVRVGWRMRRPGPR